MGDFYLIICYLFICFIQLGAAAVNLVAGEKPADVYSGIAARWVFVYIVTYRPNTTFGPFNLTEFPS